MTTLIKNGTVVNATGATAADVLVDGETIVALLSPGSTALGTIDADTVIDAAGKYVIPGGVDGCRDIRPEKVRPGSQHGDDRLAVDQHVRLASAGRRDDRSPGDQGRRHGATISP